MNAKSNPVLYILMRTDLASMNAGKAVAQGTHAANHFQSTLEAMPDKHPAKLLFKQWQKSTPQHFGTCITLGATERQLRSVVEYATRSHVPAAVIHDPTYPLLDGQVLHLLPLDTCGWVFGDKPDIQWLLKDLSLHP